MAKWNQLADKETIDRTINTLKSNGIETQFVATAKEAKELVLKLIPAGSEVMTMTSTTLDSIGLTQEINSTSSKFKPVRDKLYAMDQQTQAQEMNRLGAAQKNDCYFGQ